MRVTRSGEARSNWNCYDISHAIDVIRVHRMLLYDDGLGRKLVMIMNHAKYLYDSPSSQRCRYSLEMRLSMAFFIRDTLALNL